jgi:DmsE family decaheme c-type cytochrome
MDRRLSATLVGSASAIALLSIGILLGLASRAPAQKASDADKAPEVQKTPDAEKPTEAPASTLPPGHVGAETCKACHAEAYAKFAHTRMGRLFLHQARNAQEADGCENCHGPGQAHVEAGGGKGKGGLITFAKNDKTPVEQRNKVCLSCHTKGARIFWQGSSHESRDVACTNCHTIMEDVSGKFQLAKADEIETCGTCHLQKRAQQMRSSHMPLREGKMRCTSCHDPHGTVTPALLKEPSLNMTCFTCHAEKRGPFLWSHAPVVESCTNCHDPHGSNHEAMLKISKPRLCQQCHIETQHPTKPYGRDTGSLKFVMGRSCTDCHSTIHGSNHPAGFAFTR